MEKLVEGAGNKKEKVNEQRIQLIYENFFQILENVTRCLICLGFDPVHFYRQYLDLAEKEQKKLLGMIENGNTNKH